MQAAERNVATFGGMRQRNTLAYCMVVAAVLCAMLACRSSPLKTMDDVHAAVRKSVSDSGRATLVVALTDELASIAKAADSEMARFRADLAALNENYDSTTGQFERAFREHDERQAQLRERLLENRNLMLKATTDEEWKSLLEIRSKTLEITQVGSSGA